MNDGDKYLVIADETYYNVAKRNMKGIVPLYYEMGKAKPQLINSKNVYNSLVNGYKFGNVGIYSNKITVMFNEKKIDLNAIKLLTCLNNFYIDGAKTGLMYKPSEAIQDRIKVANGKLPYFFQFAKDKELGQVKPMNNSTVNRICKNIEDIKQKKYSFAQHGTFRYKVLYNNEVEVNEELIKYYNKLDKEKNMLYRSSNNTKHEVNQFISNEIKNKLKEKSKELNIKYEDMVDMIIIYTYSKHKNNKKTLLWDLFGIEIINNINNNLKLSLNDNNVKMCSVCGKRFRLKSKFSNQEYCGKCSKMIHRKIDKEYRQEKRRLSLE